MFTIYTKPGCSYCDLAKALFNKNNFEYRELVLSEDAPEIRAQLLEAVPNARTVPQIFSDDEYIGGYQELRGWINTEKEKACQESPE